MESWTIQKLLNWITDYFTRKGIDSPRLSAEILLGHVLGAKRIELYTRFDTVVEKRQLDILHGLVSRAGQNEPVAYLTGKTEFYSLELDVSPACMIPRPETELLVERAIEFLRARKADDSLGRDPLHRKVDTYARRRGPHLVCDLCTGSGCIAVAIAKNFPDVRIIATDISAAALEVAAANVEKHQLKDKVTLLQGDLFEPLLSQFETAKLDLVVCNPPYVSAAEFESLDETVRCYEPRDALYAGEDGLGIYRRIAQEVEVFLQPDGALMLEIGYAQGPAVKDLLEKAGAFTQVRVEKDPQDNDRIVVAKKAHRLPGV